MTEIIAYHVEAPGAQSDIHGYTDQVVLTLALPQGNYVVHARLGMGNNDGDEQNAQCSIRVRSSFKYPDRIETRFLADTQTMWYTLQGVVTLYEDDKIDLTVATYNGWWETPSLIAFNVDGIVPPV